MLLQLSLQDVETAPGRIGKKQLRRFKPLVLEINRLEAEFEAFSDDQIRPLTAEYQEQLTEVSSESKRHRPQAPQGELTP